METKQQINNTEVVHMNQKKQNKKDDQSVQLDEVNMADSPP